MHEIALVFRIIAMALRAVWATRVRSLFVVLGVAFGVASLTLIVMAVDGANRKAVEIVSMFGHDAALVFGGNFKKRAVGARTMTLSWDDARAIRDQLPGAYQVVPMRMKNDLTVRHGNKNYQGTSVIGATEDYAHAWDWPLSEGRDLTREDVDTSARVCILGYRPRVELFGDQSAIGRSLFIGDVSFRVVGELEYRGATSGGGRDTDNRIIIPLTTLTKRYNLDRKYFRALRVKFLEPEYMAGHTENLRLLLRHMHSLRPEEDDDFTIITADEILKFLSMLKGGLAAFLGVTALCAMLVGGFVLANLFSISVSERSEEIGLKKALGARSSDVLLQFLVEALVLTAVGGLLGLVLGVGMGQILTRLHILEIVFSWKVFGVSLASALAIGLVFGLKPAREAAALDPITALKGGG